MRNLILILILILFNALSVNAQEIDWAFKDIKLRGEREQVLKVSQSLAHFYERSDIGERLINSLGKFRVRYYVESQESWDEGAISLESIRVVPNDIYFDKHLFERLSDLHRLRTKSTSQFDYAQFIKESLYLEKKVFIHPRFSFISIEASRRNYRILKFILNKIASNPIGAKLFKEMKNCGRKLEIRDDKHSLAFGGLAAPVRSSSNIFKPGVGESAFIRFRFDQPLEGAHVVKTQNGEIPFTYIDNLFHELVHAKHYMCGTFSPRTGEAQAIQEENEFRRSRRETKAWDDRDPTRYEEGRQVWFGLK